MSEPGFVFSRRGDVYHADVNGQPGCGVRLSESLRLFGSATFRFRPRAAGRHYRSCPRCVAAALRGSASEARDG